MEESLSEHEMIYNKEGDKIMAGGYSVNSILLNEGMSAMYSGEGGRKHSTDISNEVKVSDRFKHLAVPAGLFYINDLMINKGTKPNYKNDVDSEVVNDELYEKLLKLAQDDNKVKEDQRLGKVRKFTRHKKGKSKKVKTNKKKTKRK